tara:strand:- start:2914 stop:3513 length:600 start_codon:yes stop_codon:yes gene_type:complete
MTMVGSEIEQLIKMLSRLPGLGPRSSRRVALSLLDKRETLLKPLISALSTAEKAVVACGKCGNLDATDPCGLCTSDKRDRSKLCVVEDVASLWALERARVFSGQYHVLGGVLSPLDGMGPDDLAISDLLLRAADTKVCEVILALSATVDGQTTAHYLTDKLVDSGVAITKLAHGVPIGGELDYLDDGTLGAAIYARRPV